MNVFNSKKYHGVIMNQYGVVIHCGQVQPPALRDAVHREAKAEGWSLRPSENKDVGMVWCPPPTPDDGKGSE